MKSSKNLYKLILLIFIIMEAKVIQFRRGRKTVHERHFLIEIKGVNDRKSAGKYVGKAVEWKSPAGS